MNIYDIEMIRRLFSGKNNTLRNAKKLTISESIARIWNVTINNKLFVHDEFVTTIIYYSSRRIKCGHAIVCLKKKNQIGQCFSPAHKRT